MVDNGDRDIHHALAFVYLPTLNIAMVRRELTTFAGGLPVLLWLLAVVGMLWADVTWADGLTIFADTTGS